MIKNISFLKLANKKMLKINLILFTLFYYSLSPFWAQVEESDTLKNQLEEIFIAPDEYPIFIDSSGLSMNNFIKTYLRYPNPEDCFEGKVWVKCEIDIDGRIMNIKILRGLNEAMDLAAIEIVKKMHFIPGKHMGSPILMPMIIPIYFSNLSH